MLPVVGHSGQVLALAFAGLGAVPSLASRGACRPLDARPLLPARAQRFCHKHAPGQRQGLAPHLLRVQRRREGEGNRLGAPPRDAQLRPEGAHLRPGGVRGGEKSCREARKGAGRREELQGCQEGCRAAGRVARRPGGVQGGRVNRRATRSAAGEAAECAACTLSRPWEALPWRAVRRAGAAARAGRALDVMHPLPHGGSPPACAARHAGCGSGAAAARWPAARAAPRRPRPRWWPGRTSLHKKKTSTQYC